MRYSILFLLFIILFSSCSDEGMNDPDKRNENWCWHVSKATGKGEWIQLGGENSFPDGFYTLFYSNGNIFEKGETQYGTVIDTINSFDINGKNSKYTYYSSDSSYEYYINEGPYKAWNKKGELVEEATIINHKVSNPKWHGQFEYFINVVEIFTPSKIAFSALSKKIAASINNASEAELKAIPDSDFHALDSLINIADQTYKKSVAQMSNLSDIAEMSQLKITSIDLLKAHKTLLKCLVESIGILKTGFNESTLQKSQDIITDFASKDVTESKFSNAMETAQQKLELDLGQMLYLKNRFPQVTRID